MPRDPLRPPEPPAPRRSDSKEIVEAIIGAAKALADPEVSVQHIADRAGVGVASVYRYFPNRGAIYAEISRRLHMQALEQLREVFAAPPDDDHELALAVSRAVLKQDASPALRRCLNLVVPRSWSVETAEVLISTTLDVAIAFFEERLVPPPADLRARVFAAFASTRGLIAVAMMYPDLAPDEDQLVQIMARGLVAHIYAD